jgi:hypothetical protein
LLAGDAALIEVLARLKQPRRSQQTADVIRSVA